MEVGDSFFVEGGNRKSIVAAGSQYRRTHNAMARFVTRKVEGGVRCWRVA